MLLFIDDRDFGLWATELFDASDGKLLRQSGWCGDRVEAIKALGVAVEKSVHMGEILLA
jgi:hypothetical protein